MNQNLLFCKALEFIKSEREMHPAKSFESLLDEAGMRFNLSPKETCELRSALMKLLSNKVAGK